MVSYVTVPLCWKPIRARGPYLFLPMLSCPGSPGCVWWGLLNLVALEGIMLLVLRDTAVYH
ncbi:uncharacterized protein BDV14DRAFT_167732 [Aspergillus stella-maris]|uniref:uncharacterized protein n=1 Tax=Aspergillus stella-maris TaxID=1810926 RepID=UPI003CCDD100